MSSVYTAFKDGYAREASYASTGIANDAATTYLVGSLSQKSIHPSPRTSINYRATGVNALEVPAGELWKSYFNLMGMWGFGVQNGVFLEWVMGASSTTGTDPYTHTITTPTDGTQLPSLTIQHERTGPQAHSYSSRSAAAAGQLERVRGLNRDGPHRFGSCGGHCAAFAHLESAKKARDRAPIRWSV